MFYVLKRLLYLLLVEMVAFGFFIPFAHRSWKTHFVRFFQSLKKIDLLQSQKQLSCFINFVRSGKNTLVFSAIFSEIPSSNNFYRYFKLMIWFYSFYLKKKYIGFSFLWTIQVVRPSFVFFWATSQKIIDIDIVYCRLVLLKKL